MKNILSILALTIFVNLSFGQNVNPTVTKNYVHKTVYKKGFQETDLGNAVADDKIETIGYFDGLGRPIQTVNLRAGGAKEDILTHIEYDVYGRQLKEFLPFAAANNEGKYDVAALTSTGSFYNTSKYENTLNPYSEKEVENSPLSRVFKQAAPGDDWELGNGNEIEFEYTSNSANEVRLYNVNLTSTYSPSISGSGYYPANSLFKTITKDENHNSAVSAVNHTTEEFKDKSGRVVLKRTYNNGVAHDTYYVYDNYGNLTYVIPPKVDTSNGISASDLNDLCYQYMYDHRNRLVEKKIPGKSWEYIIYNILDQPVLTQDANLRVDYKWNFTKYDRFGRVVYTGIFQDGDGFPREYIQNEFSAGSAVFETRQTSNQNLRNTTIYYSDNSFPLLSEGDTETKILTINYYDDYGHIANWPGQTWSFGEAFTSMNQGLLLSSEERILGTTTWNKNRFYYDDKGRVIRSDVDYYDGAHQYSNFQNTFLGTTEYSNNYFRQNSSQDYRYYLIRSYYDHMERMTSNRLHLRYGQNSDLDYEAEELISKPYYDELGQVYKKLVGNETGAPIQTVDYKYNIRGWLKKINDVSSLGNDLFGFTIKYNDPDNSDPLFNGNISQVYWKTANTDNSTKSYYYTYDDLNRLTDAIDFTGKFNLQNVNYDKNGNITSLVRKGHIVDNPVLSNSSHYGNMDNLTYFYDSGNKLLKVTDAANPDKYGFVDDALNYSSDTADDYTYDANGNMLRDYNKGIDTDITYNHLNLPELINFGGGNKIEYLYSATGLKLKKTVTENSNVTTTEYMGPVVYVDDEIKFISHEEGYAQLNPTDGTFEHVFQYKDHLGNIRLSYKGDYSYFAEDRFISGTNSWSAFGSGASVSNDNGRLKVNMTSMNTGAEKNVTVPVGERVKISLNLMAGSTSSAKINYTITEFDASNNQLTNRVYDNRWSIFQTQFTTAGTRIRIRAQKQTNDGQLTYFYIDDYEVKTLDGAEIVEENNYYPFGLKHKGYNGNINGTEHPYKYNGKELNEELGLDWIDYGARNYDASLGRWMNIDPLAETMPEYSPYNYAFNNPIYFLDPDGERPCPNGDCGGAVVAVFYHGGPTGGGNTTTPEKSGTTGKIYNQTQNYAESQGREFKGTIIAPGATSASGVNTALRHIIKNLNPDDQLIVYGYSYGVDVAVDLTQLLDDAGVDVDLLLVTVDGSDGPLQNSTVNTDIPANVDTNLNVYQDDDSGTSSSSRSSRASSSGTSSGSSKSSSNSDSGSSNSPGSNGGPNSAVNSKKTKVINKNITGEGVNHGNIQSKAQDLINKQIQDFIKSFQNQE